MAVAIDSSGNIYSGNTDSILGSRISKIESSGRRVTDSYTFNHTFSGSLSSIAFDSSQNLYINFGNCMYKVINQGSNIYTYPSLSVISGYTRMLDGTTGYVNGSASTAKFLSISGMIFDSVNNLYVTDVSNHCIRKIAVNGDVSTYAGALPTPYSYIRSGITYFGNEGTSGYIDATGTAARFNFPKGITIDSSGNLYVVDSRNKMIRKISISGVVTTISKGYTNSDGTTTDYSISITGITIDPSGNLYVTDKNIICKIGSTGLYDARVFISSSSIPSNSLMTSIVRDSIGFFYVKAGDKILKISQTCLAGSYPNNGICETCPLGSYSATGTVCTACPVGTSTPSTGSSNSNQCTEIAPGHYMSNTTIIQCPPFTICPGGSRTTTRGYTCMHGYQRSPFNFSCVPCRIGSYGSNELCMPCTDIAPTSTIATWTTLATAQTSCIPETCKPNHKLNRLLNICEPCPLNTGGSNCTEALPGYYISNGVIIPCPSNASCTGGSTSFICSNGYMLNQMEDGCLQCQQGFGGPNCTEAFPGYYLRDNRPVPCPSNAICEGGIGSYTCSNGYFVNNTNGTCDVVTTIIQPGNSQLRNTIGPPTIADTTGCTPTGCVLLFKDPGSDRMLPVNPCIRQGNSYDFRTKKCVSKCCFMPMLNARTNSDCKTYVINTQATKNTSLCRTNPKNPCCKATAIPTNADCKRFWTPGVSTWSPAYNRLCTDGFTDYNKLETMLEKRQKWYESRKILNSS